MKKLVYILFILFAVSCDRKQTKENTIYLEATEQTIVVDSLLKSINLIYLEDSDSLFIGEISKIKKYESTYYLLDSHKNKAIYLYDDHGNYISNYHAFGGGPGEYTSILDFDIDTIKGEIIALCYPSKLVFTDLQLSFKKEVSLEGANYDRMVIINDNIYLYSYYDETIGNYDLNGVLKSRIKMPNRLLKGNIFHPQPVFYKLSDKYLMHSPGDDIIYKEENGRWIEYLNIDYKKRESSMKLYSQKSVTDITFEEKVAHPLPYIKYFFEHKGKDNFVYLFGFLHYLNDMNDNFSFSELPGRSMSYNNNQLYAWEYFSNFNLSDPTLIRILKDIEISYVGTELKDSFNDGILLIEYNL